METLKYAVISMLCGFIGAGAYMQLKPPKTLITQFAVIDVTNPDGTIKTPQELATLNYRADRLAEHGIVILNKSAVYHAPSEIIISGKLKKN